MKGQPENPLDVGIGKKVEATTEDLPEWKAVPGRQYHYINSKGQKAYCPPVPDGPMHPSPWDIWREYMKANGIQPTF